MPRVSRTSSMDSDPGKALRGRSMSMEEADQPKGVYSTSPTRFGSPPKFGSSPAKTGTPVTNSAE